MVSNQFASLKSFQRPLHVVRVGAIHGLPQTVLDHVAQHQAGHRRVQTYLHPQGNAGTYRRHLNRFATLIQQFNSLHCGFARTRGGLHPSISQRGLLHG